MKCNSRLSFQNEQFQTIEQNNFKTASRREVETLERFAALQLDIINDQIEITTTRRHMLPGTFLMFVLDGCCGK